MLGLVCMGLLFILGYDIMTQGRMFAAREIAVLGNRQLSEARVLSLAGIDPGVNIFAVNLSLARKRLISDGWIAEARVGREIPDRLVIRVREHVPQAILDLGKKYVMSREGDDHSGIQRSGFSGTSLRIRSLLFGSSPGRRIFPGAFCIAPECSRHRSKR